MKAWLDESGGLHTEGKIAVNDVYSGFCCEGHNWQVLLVAARIDVPLTLTEETRYETIWGACMNQDCPCVDEMYKDSPQDDLYRGITYWSIEDFAEKLTYTHVNGNRK